MAISKAKAKIPGTDEYKAEHGQDQMAAATNQVKAHMPGTEAHQQRKAGDPGHQTQNPGGQNTGLGSGLGLPGLRQLQEHIPGTLSHEIKKDRE